MRRYAARSVFRRLPECHIIAPRKLSAFRAADHEFCIVTKPVWSARSWNSDSMISNRLSQVDAGTFQICHQHIRSSTVREFLCLSFHHHCHEAARNSNHFANAFDHPSDPRFSVQFEPNAVRALVGIRRTSNNQINRIVRLRFHPLKAIGGDYLVLQSSLNSCACR